MRSVLIAVLAGLAAAAATPTGHGRSAGSKPNIVILLTDDQDLTLGGLTPVPNVQKLIAEQGLTFTNGFVHTPVCCPSRSSYLTGRYIHNGGALNNTIVGGNCVGELWRNSTEKAAMAVHVKAAGYRTSYAGKYLNNYALGGTPGCAKTGDESCGYIPPGWDRWCGLVGNSKYYDYDVVVDGKTVKHGSNYANDYFPDLVANFTVNFIHSSHQNYPDDPIFVFNAWPTPHGPHTPAPQYQNAYSGATAPRTPNYNASDEVCQKKHWLIRQEDIIDENAAAGIDSNFAGRWESLLSVNDHVQRIFDALEATGRLNNTYVFYLSDHGFQLGQMRLLGDKRHLYENDIRIPYMVRGPGVPVNATSALPVLNIDIAPTIVDLITGSIPDDMDGQSFAAVLRGETPSSWRTDFMIDYHGEYNRSCGLMVCPPPVHPQFHEIDAVNNTYQCVRTLSSTSNTIYCEFVDDENFVEYYDINADPWQLNNAADQLTPSQRQDLQQRLNALRKCAGVECRQL